MSDGDRPADGGLPTREGSDRPEGRQPRPSAGLRLLASLGLTLALVQGCASAPAYLSMGAEELWTSGSLAYEEEDWNTAIERLERFVTISPGDARVPEARTYVARSYMGRGEYLTAATEFGRFMDLHPSHGLVPEASLGVCQAYAELSPIPQRDQSYTRQAMATCGETSFEFRGLSIATQADSIGMVMLNRLAEADYLVAEHYRTISPLSADDYFEVVVSQYPQSVWAPRALLEIYRLYRSLGWGPEAEEASVRLLNNFPESEAARQLTEEERGADEPEPAPDGDS